MAIVLTDSLKKLLIETASQLKGAAKRKFMTTIVQGLGLGGQRLAESELGWNRDTIRKGTRELKSGGWRYSVIPDKNSEELLHYHEEQIQQLSPEELQAQIQAEIDEHQQQIDALKQQLAAVARGRTDG
ncbi:MAG: hypothetical protein HWQ58_16745 [Nostoc sp. LPT]|nr:hypothetical protein [Nostoc sp. LPT]